MDIYFPEFLNLFSSWEGKTAVMTLERMALPADIMQMTAEKILLIWREEVKRGAGIRKAHKLLEIAAKSVGIIVYTPVTKDVIYDPEILLNDIHRNKAPATLTKLSAGTFKI